MMMLKVSEAAAKLRLSEYRTRQLLRQGKLSGVRAQGTANWRIPDEAIQKYLDSHPKSQSNTITAQDRARELFRDRRCPHCNESISILDALSMVRGCGVKIYLRVIAPDGSIGVVQESDFNPQTMTLAPGKVPGEIAA